jgi:hypothetical protein
MKFRVAFEVERADETVGSIRMDVANSIATSGRDDLMVETPSPLHRIMAQTKRAPKL